MNRCLLILLSCCLLFSCHRKVEEHETWHIPFLQQSAGNVDSVLQIWTQAQKIAQLIIYQPDISSPRSLDTLLTMGAANHFGGVLLRDLPFQDFLWVADSLQRMAQAPLFLATDEAVSLTNQFSNLSHFPYSASLAAVADDSLEYQLQDFFLRQCEATGINFCLSPHLNPLDWADGKRAVVFDQDRDAILQSTSRQLEQLQEKGILSVARHFTQYYPHQADTSQLVDSLLHPYYNLCRNGLSGLMIDGQLFDRDSADWRATNYLRSYLQKRLDFQGLIVVRHQGKADELRRQVRAGAHVFMTSQNPKVLIDSISQYIAEGLLTEYALEERVRKVLLAKQWLRKDRVLDQIDIQADQQLFNNEAFPFYVRQLQQKALTLVNDPDSILPFQNIHRRSYRLYEVGAYRMTSFQRFFEKYAAVHTEQVPFIDTVGYAAIPYKQAKRSTVIISLNQVSIAAEPRLVESINALAAKQEVVLINWAYPNNLALFDPSIAMIQLYEQDKINQALTAQLLFGAIAPQGRLPLDISANLTKGTRLNRPVTRLQYGIPEEVGIAAYKLVSIDAIVQQAIRLGAFPGAQVLVAKEGKVIYQKSFGKHQFDNRQLVHADDLYDLASITKIASTTLAMMHLYEQRAFKLNSAIGPYIQCDKKQPIGKLSFKRLLTHQSGLQANMPIAPFIMFEDTTNLACNTYFCKSRKSPTDIQIADSMFMTSTWVDSIWQEVYSLKPRRRKRFRYSDVNFNLIQRFIESHTKMGLDRFVNQQFYRSLHMQHTAFRPLEKFKAHQIIPTTDDKKWRKQLLRGYVHDESAALLGGVGGNSGLFSNTQDLAVLFQMLLNGGNYGGKKYLKKSTIDYFTAARHGNHRGLGFDKPTKTRNRTSSDKASRQTYGHTGFTGTCVWVDPAEDLIFIFLTNRISPDIHNKKIFKHKVRKRLHNVVYEALNTYEAPTDVLLPREEVNLERVRASVE